MKKIVWLSFIVFFLTSLSVNVFAQSDNRGTDFWVCFPQNAQYENAGIIFRLYITADQDANGTVTGISKNKRFSLKAGKVASIDIDTIAQVMGSEQVQNVGIHIQSDQPVSVYGLSNRKASTDTYVALPTNVLGTSYRAMGYDALIDKHGESSDLFTSQITFVSTEDNTVVTILLTGNTREHRRHGDEFHVTLDKGQVYQIQGSHGGDNRSDLTGTLVTSTKPIAFFTGHTCAEVPAGAEFCDQLLEEEPPSNTWGKQFLVSKMLGKDWYVVRVVANEDDTKIFFDQKFIKTLAAGEFYEAQHLYDNVLITSDKPVLVGQYATSANADTVKIGDPFMMLIAPTEQFLSSYRFVTPIKGDWHHYINIVVPSGSINSLRLDNNGISLNKFSPIGITRYVIGQLEISFGSHTITADRPFGLYSYGFGVAGDNYDSYGNIAGMRVAPIERTADTSKPTLEVVESDTAGVITLIARDDRINDLGLAQILLFDSSTTPTTVTYPTFDPGAPEVKIKINKVELANCMYIKLQDFAKNQSYYALCPAQPNTINTSNQGSKYLITPVLLQQQVPHEIYPLDIYPSPARFGQPVTIDFSNSVPEIIAVEVFDESSNLVAELQKKQLTGAGKHSLIYLSERYATGNYFLRLMAYSQDGQVIYQQDARFVVIK
jgi:hypothetical protein